MSQKLEHLKNLFAGICRDDKSAFAELFRMEYKRLHSFSMQYVNTPESAEEVVNDVFIKIWKYRQSLHTIKNPESYLFIAVKNQSINYCKKYSALHISVREEGSLAELIVQHSPEYDIEWKELQFRLNQVINQLPDQCRTVFKLMKEEGFKAKQVAEILNISVRTVETQLYRAMKRLSQALADQFPRKRKRWNGLNHILFLFF